MPNFTVTEPAQEYLKNLIDTQNLGDPKGEQILGVRLGVERAGSPRAETILSYCRTDTLDDTVFEVAFGELKFYVDKKSEKYLEEATINYDSENFGGHLTIKAPNSKLPKLGEDASLEDKVNYVLWNDVNPMVAMHGGEVNLVEITEDKIAILSFGGGCQGCAQVDITLKHGVEDQLLQSVPELSGVKDITDHSDTSNAYY